MPSKTAKGAPGENDSVEQQVEAAYTRLLSFLQLATDAGFSLAAAICDGPFLRQELLGRIIKDACHFSVNVQHVDISLQTEPDLLGAMLSALRLPLPKDSALMITGIDELIYERAERSESRTPLIARLNFDRERLSRTLLVPVVLWLENESFNLLVREAPDLTQWISARFLFPMSASQFVASLEHDPYSKNDHSGSEFGQTRLPRDLHTHQEERILEERENVVGPLRALFARVDDYRGRGELKKEERALAVASELAARTPDLALKQNLALRRADLFRRLRQPKRALQLLHQAFSTTADAAYPKLQIDLAWVYSACLIDLGDFEAAKRVLEHAVELVYDTDTSLNNAVRSAFLVELGKVLIRLGDQTTAVQRFEEARSIAVDINIVLSALSEEATLAIQREDYETARKLYEQQLALATRAKDPESQQVVRAKAIALANLGLVDSRLGNNRRAIHSLQEAAAVAHQLPDGSLRSFVLSNLGSSYASVGKYEEALMLTTEAIELARQSADTQSEAMGLYNLGLILRRLGRMDESNSRMRSALTLFEDLRDPRAKTVREALGVGHD